MIGTRKSADAGKSRLLEAFDQLIGDWDHSLQTQLDATRHE
jgi:hypothetical protein